MTLRNATSLPKAKEIIRGEAKLAGWYDYHGLGRV